MSQPGPAPRSEQQAAGSGARPGPCRRLRLPPGKRLAVADKGELRVSGVTVTAGEKVKNDHPLQQRLLPYLSGPAAGVASPGNALSTSSC